MNASCDGCGAALVYRGRGRPRRWCRSCAEKQRAYREANKADIAEKQRAYYEANKADIAEKKRAYYEANKADIALGAKTILCSDCGERLARRTEDGLCGFCRQGIPADPRDIESRGVAA